MCGSIIPLKSKLYYDEKTEREILIYWFGLNPETSILQE